MNARGLFAIVGTAFLCAPALAQSVYVNGFEFSPLGTVSSLSLTERRLTACCLGSSGEDGVEVHFNTKRGASLDLDISEFNEPTPPGGREIKIRRKGWDGLIYGTHRITGSFADDSIQEACSFNNGPSGVQIEIICTGASGVVTVLPPQETQEVTWATHVHYGPGEQPTWTFGSGRQHPTDTVFVAHRETDRPATCDFATTTGGVISVPDVVSIQCRPICIVAPCPGDWTDLASMQITGTGMNAVKGGNVEYEWKVEEGQSLTHGTGGAILSESCCTDLDGDGLNDLAVIASNIGSSGEDGVTTHFPGGCDGASRKWGNGHVTLMKMYDDGEGTELRLASSKDDLACTTSFTPDFSSLGSTQWTITVRDRFGNALLSDAVVGLGGSFTVDTCGGTSNPASPPSLNSSVECRVTVTQQVYVRVTFVSNVQCTLSTGVVVPGAASIEMRPFQPFKKFRKLFQWRMTSLGGDILAGEPEILPPNAPVCPADVDNGTGSGTSDGGVDISDLLFFLTHFEQGC